MSSTTAPGTCPQPPTNLLCCALLHVCPLQGEDVALFSIDGNHVGYENQLDLPNRINFDGSFLKFGPFKVSLAPLDGALAAVINTVNKAIVPGIEFLQYRSYNAVTSRILVRKPCQKQGMHYRSRELLQAA